MNSKRWVRIVVIVTIFGMLATVVASALSTVA